MFNKKEFSNILQKISTTYSSISEFAEKSGVNRTYISKYINMKLDNPPTPKILEKIADASNGIITYKRLMLICNYISDTLDAIAGESIEMFSNPYIDKSVCTPSEKYIYDIIYTYSILETTNYTSSQKEKIIDSYNYIKSDKEYSKYISKNENYKKQYYEKNQKDYLLDKSDIRNPENTDLDKLQIGLSTKDYSNISDDQIKQIEDFAKFVLKDNKKEDKEKNENNKG